MITQVMAVGVLFLTLVATSMSAVADHLRDSEIARGKADTVLCGVDVYATPLKQVVAELGPPTKGDTTLSTIDQAGGVDYEWQAKGLRIELGAWNAKSESVPYSVEVWGTKPVRKLGRTGRGLSLGDTQKDVLRIYGNRLFVTKLADGAKYMIIQWRDDTTLYLTFNLQGQINHMHLLASVE